MGVNEYIKVGSRIRNFRQKRKMTQREVANQLGIPYSTYSNYENNNREPSFDVIRRVADILGISLWDLFDEKYDSANLAKRVAFLEHTEKSGDRTYELNMAFDKLNELGQQKVIDYINDLLQIERYCNPPGIEGGTLYPD